MKTRYIPRDEKMLYIKKLQELRANEVNYISAIAPVGISNRNFANSITEVIRPI